MLPHLSLQGHRPQVYSSSTPVCRGPMAQSSASLSQDVCWEALSVQQHHAVQKESKQPMSAAVPRVTHLHSRGLACAPAQGHRVQQHQQERWSRYAALPQGWLRSLPVSMRR